MSTPRTSPGQRWLLPVVLVAVAVAAGAGLLVRELYPRTAQAQPPAIIPTADAPITGAAPGPTSVQGTQDATQHPLYETVRGLLQTYFDAINAKDYRAWSSTVTETRAEDTPEENWRVDYRSTRDGSIVVYRIETGPTGTARVLLQFVSKQDVADAPLELPVDCIRWKVIFPLVSVDSRWLLDAGATGASPQHDAC